MKTYILIYKLGLAIKFEVIEDTQGQNEMSVFNRLKELNSKYGDDSIQVLLAGEFSNEIQF